MKENFKKMKIIWQLAKKTGSPLGRRKPAHPTISAGKGRAFEVGNKMYVPKSSFDQDLQQYIVYLLESIIYHITHMSSSSTAKSSRFRTYNRANQTKKNVPNWLQIACSRLKQPLTE